MIDFVIDISHYNHVTSFDKIKQAGIAGVLMKATQGFVLVDPTYESNRNKARQAGLRVGAYHFGTAGDANAQAEHFLSVAGTDVLHALDFEGNPQGHDMSLEEAEQFVTYMKRATGRYPGLYSGHTIKEALTRAGITSPDQTELSRCWLWIAQYSAAPLLPKAWKKWTLWQYTDGAAGVDPHPVPGVGRCDRSRFNGSLDELGRFWTENSVDPAKVRAAPMKRKTAKGTKANAIR